MENAAHNGLQPGRVLHGLQRWQDGPRLSRFDLNSPHLFQLVGRLLSSRWLRQ
jgi:hypothetical protein